MENEKIAPTAVEQKSRRAFVKTAAQVAVTAPAVVMLLSATTKPAAAVTKYGDDAVLRDFGDDHAADDNFPVVVSTGDDFIP